MKRLLYWSTMAFLAACVAGCGKDAEDVAKANAATATAPDLGEIVRAGASALAQKDVAAAEDAVAKALELKPESAEAWLLAGQAACMKQDYERARACFASIIKEKSLPNALRAKAYAGKGTVEYLQHDVDAARISFFQARRLDFKNEAALYYLGLIYRDVYRFYEAAEEHLRMFARMSRPDDPRAKKVNYEIVPELRRTLASIAAARPGAGSGKPAEAAALIQEAQALEAKSQLTAAKKKYAAAYMADPLSYEASLGYARMLRRTDKSKEGVRKAILAYRAAIDQKPAVQKNYLEVARLARENQLWAQAVEIMNRAIAHDPKNKEALDQLIGALIKAGNTKLASAWAEYRKDLGR